MKLKISWGTGLFIVIVVFVLSVAATFYFTLQQKTDLVEKDYYPKEIAYQEQIDRINNARALEQDIVIDRLDEGFLFTFPLIDSLKKPNGTIHFYRPSDKNLDRKIPIDLDIKYTQITNPDLITGKYIIKILWELNGIEYYKEETIIIP